MSYGISENSGRFGFESVADWFMAVLLSFPRPWTVGDLNGKYYGTEVYDSRGVCILSFWKTEGEKPSSRELGDWTYYEWSELLCDTHWESESALKNAQKVVDWRNRIDRDESFPQEHDMVVIRLIIESGSWDSSVFEDVSCGGPNRRPTTHHST